MRLGCADEGTHEFAIDRLGNGVDIETFAAEELPRIFDAIDSGWLNADGLEARSLQFRPLLVFFKRASDASDPQQHVATYLLRHRAPRHHVRHGKPTAGLQDPERLAQHPVSASPFLPSSGLLQCKLK